MLLSPNHLWVREDLMLIHPHGSTSCTIDNNLEQTPSGGRVRCNVSIVHKKSVYDDECNRKRALRKDYGPLKKHLQNQIILTQQSSAAYM